MDKKAVIIVVIVALLYFSVGLPCIFFVSNDVGDTYFNQIGKSGLLVASKAAEDIKLSDDDVKHLKSLKYSELPFDETNIMLENATKKSAEIVDAKYIYLMTVLDSDEIKYKIESDDVNYYEGSLGQDLNVIWLLNVDIHDGDLTNRDFPENYENDKDRYSYMRDSDLRVYLNRESTFLYSSDEFGDNYITAYAPVYTTEGSFVGMLGVDIFANEYDSFLRNITIIFSAGGILIFVLLMFALISFIRNKKNSQLLMVVSERVSLDALTGIFNRNGLEKFEKNNYMALKESGRFITAVMIDVDHFKAINDEYGHDVGDDVLLGIAKVMRENIRMPNDYPVRYGGDEFLIIFTNVSREEVIAIVNRIKNNICNHSYSSHNLKITVSIGISTTVGAKDAKLLEHIIKEADEALYESKENGRNCIICYTDQMNTGNATDSSKYSIDADFTDKQKSADDNGEDEPGSQKNNDSDKSDKPDALDN